MGDSAATDAISERLRVACPSLFTSDDATAAKVWFGFLSWTENRDRLTIFQATEMLQLARGIDDAVVKAKTIADALALYKRVANNIHLPTVCGQLESGMEAYFVAKPVHGVGECVGRALA